MVKIYCLMVDGGSLSDEISTHLFVAAQNMIKQKDKVLRLHRKTHGVDGELTTNYKFGFIGTIGGIEFATNLDYEDRTIRARFIVRPLPDDDRVRVGMWGHGEMPIDTASPALN